MPMECNKHRYSCCGITNPRDASMDARLPRKRTDATTLGLRRRSFEFTVTDATQDTNQESPIHMSQTQGDVRDGIGSTTGEHAGRWSGACTDLRCASYTAYRLPNARAPAGGPTSRFAYPSDWITGGGREDFRVRTVGARKWLLVPRKMARGRPAAGARGSRARSLPRSGGRGRARVYSVHVYVNIKTSCISH